MRYTMNAKSARPAKVFDRNKLESQIKQHYRRSEPMPKAKDMTELIMKINNHFMKRKEG